MPDPLQFTIPGPPVAQGRGRATVVAGRAKVYDPKKSRDWKHTVGATALAAGARPIEGPVVVELTFIFARPVSTYRKKKPRGREPKMSAPDCDNLGKGVCDALNGVAYLDDRQVVGLAVTKWVGAQGEPARTVVVVREWGSGDE